MTPVFETTIVSHGGTTAGIEIPGEVVTALGGGGRPAVVVRLNDYPYRSSIAVMGGQNLIGMSNKVRAESGLAAGDVVEVELTLDTAPRVITPPEDLAVALAAAPGARDAWDRWSYSHQRQHAEAVEAAKRLPTRERRVATIIDHRRGRRPPARQASMLDMSPYRAPATAPRGTAVSRAARSSAVSVTSAEAAFSSR